MKANTASFAGKAGCLLLSLTLILTLTGCDPAFFGPPYGGGYGAYAPAYRNTNYVYYPNHGNYYHPQTGMYHHYNGSSWVSGPRPYGVSSNVLLGSPSVPLNLNSHPQYHHNNIVQTYPRNWTAPNNWRGWDGGNHHHDRW